MNSSLNYGHQQQERGKEISLTSGSLPHHYLEEAVSCLVSFLFRAPFVASLCSMPTNYLFKQGIFSLKRQHDKAVTECFFFTALWDIGAMDLETCSVDDSSHDIYIPYAHIHMGNYS
jgi:hypothetical protein